MRFRNGSLPVEQWSENPSKLPVSRKHKAQPSKLQKKKADYNGVRNGSYYSELELNLLHPPSSIDELLPLLDEAEVFLTSMRQSQAKSVLDALSPFIKALVADELLRHSDVDVKVALASCLCQIIRITSPVVPYNDEKMEVVIRLIFLSFENLDDLSSRSFKKRALILYTVSKIPLLVFLVRKCKGLVSELFQHFLKTIREYHPDNIISSMEAIMIRVLENNTKDIYMELVTKLLAGVKKENEEIKPIGKRLAERVFVKCAVKLKPYIKYAVKSLGISLDEYSEVITSILQGTSVTVEDKSDTSKELLSLTSSDVNGENFMVTEYLAMLGDHGPCDQQDIVKLASKSNFDDSQDNNSIQLEKSEQTANKQGTKSSSQTKLAEPLDQDHVNNEKLTEKLPDSQRSQRDIHGSSVEYPPENHPDERNGRCEDIDSFPADDSTSEFAKLFNENNTSAEFSPQNTYEDEAANVVSLHPSQFLFDEEEPVQPKENNVLVHEESLSTEIASKKSSERTSDSGKKRKPSPPTSMSTTKKARANLDIMQNISFMEGTLKFDELAEKIAPPVDMQRLENESSDQLCESVIQDSFMGIYHTLELHTRVTTYERDLKAAKDKCFEQEAHMKKIQEDLHKSRDSIIQNYLASSEYQKALAAHLETYKRSEEHKKEMDHHLEMYKKSEVYQKELSDHEERFLQSDRCKNIIADHVSQAFLQGVSVAEHQVYDFLRQHYPDFDVASEVSLDSIGVPP